ncbi:hypothetical protein GYA54_00435 [Candidatus Kuenenbacteria bacterium]|nr:hypothetical protein [Candidatus Kuenenbacteria bacterium]
MQKVFSDFFGWLAVVTAGLGGFFMTSGQYVFVVLSIYLLAKTSGRINYGHMTETELRRYCVINSRDDTSWPPIAPPTPEKMLRTIR